MKRKLSEEQSVDEALLILKDSGVGFVLAYKKKDGTKNVHKSMDCFNPHPKKDSTSGVHRSMKTNHQQPETPDGQRKPIDWKEKPPNHICNESPAKLTMPTLERAYVTLFRQILSHNISKIISAWITSELTASKVSSYSNFDWCWPPAPSQKPPDWQDLEDWYQYLDCPIKKPRSLKPEERLVLFLHLLRFDRSGTPESLAKFNIAKLEQSTKYFCKEFDETSWASLEEIYRVRRLEIGGENEIEIRGLDKGLLQTPLIQNCMMKQGQLKNTDTVAIWKRSDTTRQAESINGHSVVPSPEAIEEGDIPRKAETPKALLGYCSVGYASGEQACVPTSDGFPNTSATHRSDRADYGVSTNGPEHLQASMSPTIAVPYFADEWTAMANEPPFMY
ncbi:hypothetical protein ACLMJK_004882 [Lecanora helva]